jgi:uncharacterized membrane protein YiaA
MKMCRVGCFASGESGYYIFLVILCFLGGAIELQQTSADEERERRTTRFELIQLALLLEGCSLMQ